MIKKQIIALLLFSFGVLALVDAATPTLTEMKGEFLDIESKIKNNKSEKTFKDDGNPLLRKFMFWVMGHKEEKALFAPDDLKPKLKELTEKIALKMGMKKENIPKTNYNDGGSFAFGNYIFLGSCIFTMKKESQLKYVVAHELAHIHNGHMWKKIAMYLSSGSAIGGVLWYLKKYAGFGKTLVVGAPLGLLAFRLINQYYCRLCEYDADKTAAQTIGIQASVEAAKEEIELINKIDKKLNQDVSFFKYLFRTHPTRQERLQQFESMKNDEKKD